MTFVLWKRIAPFALLAVYAGLSLSAISQKSATWDETHYLGLGCFLVGANQQDIPSAALHPPLSYYIHSLPLLFCNLDRSCFEKGSSSDVLSGVRRGQCLMRNSRPSGDTILNLARLPMIGVGILLGWFVYLWACALYGTGGGLLSLFLYCLSPNILAHTGLITPDLCLTAFGFMTIYFFWQAHRTASIPALVFCGLTLGLTLLSKYSGLLWVPMLVLLAVLEGLRLSLSTEPGRGLSGRDSVVHTGGALLVAFIVLCLGYGFDLSNFFTGIDDQRWIVGDGFPAFLSGQVSRNGGWWYYYLYAFLVKVPIPAMILMAAALFTRGTQCHGGRSSLLWLIAPALLIIASFSAFNQVNIGLRYVLPAFPFLIVFAGKSWVLWRRRKILWGFVVVSLMIWYAGESLSIHPHYLAYFNQFAGGPKSGYRHLVDSNLDWGQDLKALKNYMDEKGIKSVKLSYFGTADPDQYGIRYESLPSFVSLRTMPKSTEIRKGDLLAVSATNLYPLYVDLGPLGEYCRNTLPEHQIGHSILIYTMKRDVNVSMRE